MQGEPAVDVQRHRQGHRHLPDQSVQECGLIAKRRCGGCITGKASDNLLVEDNHVVLHPIGHESCGVYVSQGARAQHRRDQIVDGHLTRRSSPCCVRRLGHQTRLTDP